MAEPRGPVELLSVDFNQDAGCFSCATSSGFRVYNCDPFKETFRREFDDGGIGQVQMLFRCNILALVGGGSNPKYPPNKVMMWDDHQSRCIGELSFRSQVRAVRLRRDRIVVVLEHKIYVYNFADLKLLHQIETIANAKGLCALSPTSNATVLAAPGLHKGQVRVELYDQKRTKFISAHNSQLASLALSLDGSRLATASEKGTLIRVFDTHEGTPLQEVRRGSDHAEIYSISFHPSLEWLALSSNKATIHIYHLNEMAAAKAASGSEEASGRAGATAGPTGSPSASNASIRAPSFMKGLLPKYFSSEWSFAKYHLPDSSQRIVAFSSQPNELVVVGMDGYFHRVAFDPAKGGDCTQLTHACFMSLDPAETQLTSS